MTKVAFITGGTGYIGSNLVRALENHGWETHLLIRESSKHQTCLPADCKRHNHYYDGQLGSVLKAIEKSKPDIVFHLASCFIAEHQAKDIENLINSNVLLGAQLLEAMSCCDVKKLVNAATSWQYYHAEHYAPANLYSATKEAHIAIEKYYIEAKSFNIIDLYIFDTYGPCDPRGKILSKLIAAIGNNEPILLSPGDQEINLVYIDDVIQAFLDAASLLRNGAVKESYAISYPVSLTLRQIVHEIETVTGYSLPIKWGGRKYRAREIMKPPQFIPTIKGWEPKYSLPQGIRAILDLEAKIKTASL